MTSRPLGGGKGRLLDQRGEQLELFGQHRRVDHEALARTRAGARLHLDHIERPRPVRFPALPSTLAADGCRAGLTVLHRPLAASGRRSGLTVLRGPLAGRRPRAGAGRVAPRGCVPGRAAGPADDHAVACSTALVTTSTSRWSEMALMRRSG